MGDFLLENLVKMRTERGGKWTTSFFRRKLKSNFAKLSGKLIVILRVYSDIRNNFASLVGNEQQFCQFSKKLIVILSA